MSQRERQQTKKNSSMTFTVILLLASIFSFAALAAVTINKPSPGAEREGMGMRSATRAHKGADYADGCGTKITTTAPVSCYTGTGWGAYAIVKHDCGVEELFAHLNRCVAGESQVITGGAAGTAGAGNSTGCHLHYEIRINGCFVNPGSAFGKDLCQESVKQELLADAKSRIGNFATCSASNSGTQQNTSSSSSNDQSGYKSVTAVYTGGTDPITGVVNTGSGYTVSETFDGRIIIEPLVSEGENDIPPLPETNTDVVPTGSSSNDPTGCATDTWKAMVNQSVLQTRREGIYNQTFIAKPDSVVSYSCMSQDLKMIGEKVGPIFSETKRWVNASVDLIGKTVTINKELGETSLDGAINIAVMTPYDSYLNDNFYHSFLGGTLGSASTGDDESSGSPQAHVPCGTMQDVWKMAKCKNIEPMFKKFDELIEASSDPRKYPENMSCKNTGITQEMIDIAKGRDVKMSKVKTYFDLIQPDGSCAAPVPTGVTVHRQVGSMISEEKQYTDAVCISVGCSYQNPGSSGLGTCEVKGP